MGLFIAFLILSVGNVSEEIALEPFFEGSLAHVIASGAGDMSLEEINEEPQKVISHLHQPADVLLRMLTVSALNKTRLQPESH